MYTHVSDVPCLPLASYRASLDGEAHISPQAFERCAAAIVSAYRAHYQTVGLTTAQAEEDAETFVSAVFEAIPQPIRDAAGFPGQNIPDVATDATEENDQAPEVLDGLHARSHARARYDEIRGIDPERQTGAEIIAHERERAAERTYDQRVKTIRDLDARILRLQQYAAQDEESERPDYRATARRRRAVMIAACQLRRAVLKSY